VGAVQLVQNYNSKVPQYQAETDAFSMFFPVIGVSDDGV